MEWFLTTEAFKLYSNLFYAIGGFGLFVKIARQLYKRRMRSKVYAVDAVQKNQLEIYKQLSSVVENTSASKAMIVNIHNGGTRIAVGKVLYLTVVNEVNQSSLRLSLVDWENQRMDYQLTEMYSSVLTAPDRSLTFETASLKDGIVKESSDGQVIRFSLSHLYNHEPKESIFNSNNIVGGKSWFLCLAFQDNEEITPEQKGKIRACRTAITNILKKQYKYE